MADKEAGLKRVNRLESNNRKGAGKGGKVPVKSGAKKGFASNKTAGTKIVGRP
jgi:hypothetical protein